MSYDLSFEGLKNSATFKVGATTKGEVEADPKQIIGKVVAIVGNGEVGYGEDGDDPIGVVSSVEYNTTYDHELMVCVNWGQTFEGIKCAGSETAGDYLACDGTGGVKTSVEPTCCRALSVDTVGTVCAIKIV